MTRPSAARRFPVPIQDEVLPILRDLLARGVAVGRTPVFDPREDPLALVAGYVTDDGDVSALCVVDGPFAVLAGSALVMVPAVAAKEQLAAGELDPFVVENVHEIANVVARLVNSNHTPHLAIHEVHPAAGELPDRVVEILDRPVYRRDFVVTIEGYGEGRLGLLVT